MKQIAVKCQTVYTAQSLFIIFDIFNLMCV